MRYSIPIAAVAAAGILYGSDIRADVQLTLIPVTVTDLFGAPVAGLSAGDFRLFEDGVEQQVKYFTSDDAPVSLGVVFDTSRSMTGRLDYARAAVSRFFGTAVARDEYFLIEFNDAPRLACSFTSDTDLIEEAMTGIQPKNWTALFDAIYMGVHEMKRARNPRRVLLILSDGGDNYSRYTESEMRRMVREADVCIFSIALGGGLIRQHVRWLRHLSEETGGRVWEVNNAGEMRDAVSKFSAAIREQYVLGYQSTNREHDGRYRKVRVQLTKPEDSRRLRSSWRAGYYAP